jgi:hypothetical protein
MVMATGIHWEWRGFGTVSYDFAQRFCYNLTDLLPKSELIDDTYIWIPNLEVNTKYRESELEKGLKFKRCINKFEDLEQWSENENEIFNFPLDKPGWNTLAKVLADVNLELESYPYPKPNRAETITYLKKAGCKTVSVPKMRASKLWKRSDNHIVKVEWASISTPQIITSIGLETWDENPEDEALPDEQAIDDILTAVKDLGLDKEPLKIMNYLDAVTIWASGKQIRFVEADA